MGWPIIGEAGSLSGESGLLVGVGVSHPDPCTHFLLSVPGPAGAFLPAHFALTGDEHMLSSVLCLFL